jgi:hypothetical protein
MRLPLVHPPPSAPAEVANCDHLARLVAAARGLPLGAAAAAIASPRSRGRHGNALQWHLGLSPHDARAEPDWERRIEIKLLTVWRTRAGLVCDKLKVCDGDIDPWRKLDNVLFVLADRLTRVVVGHRFVTRDGARHDSLVAAWRADTHFDAPALFVEARDGEGGARPAYYVAAAWLAAHVLPADLSGVFAGLRGAARSGDPLLAVADEACGGAVTCPRCGAAIGFDPEALRRRGAVPAHHGLPLSAPCATREHVVLARSRLLVNDVLGAEDTLATLQSVVRHDRLTRLADHVAEPDDHRH